MSIFALLETFGGGLGSGAWEDGWGKESGAGIGECVGMGLARLRRRDDVDIVSTTVGATVSSGTPSA